MEIIVGVDEAGRGPLIGSVVAAAVILDPSKPIEGVGDSKKLSEKRREKLFTLIQENAIDFAIAEASYEEIDSINILQASLLAMKRAVYGLKHRFDKVLVDGNKTPDIIQPVEAIIKGDSLVDAIGAASILAKVTRDRQMRALDEIYPGYGLASHKGYPTKAHFEALARLGPTPVHRRSFRPVREAWEAQAQS